MAFSQDISHQKKELVKEILFQLTFFILALEVMFIEVKSNLRTLGFRPHNFIFLLTFLKRNKEIKGNNVEGLNVLLLKE